VALKLRDVGGTSAGGVRYKAASGWPALHPHIAVQAPLRLEVLDRAGVAQASARYYFWNPDAPRYEGRPSDFAEALERRNARWRRDSGPSKAPRERRAPVYTDESYYTLDLRRQL